MGRRLCVDFFSPIFGLNIANNIASFGAILVLLLKFGRLILQQTAACINYCRPARKLMSTSAAALKCCTVSTLLCSILFALDE